MKSKRQQRSPTWFARITEDARAKAAERPSWRRSTEVNREMAAMKAGVYGKNAQPEGVTPAVALIDPKYPHNVGAALRAASCFGFAQVWYTGNRVPLEPHAGYRLPREERMKGYKDVTLRQFDYFFDQFGPDTVPVAIEVRENAEPLPTFVHPVNALYLFGPEDGSIGKVHLQHCHRFVVIPTKHCTNLAAAVYIVLYDRMVKLSQWYGGDPPCTNTLPDSTA